METISKSRVEAKSRVERAKMLLCYWKGESINSIAKQLGTNRPKIERTVDRAIGYGVLTALNDLPRKGANPKITQEARAWFMSIACTKPKDLGMASEFWTYNALAKYVRENCEEVGHPSLGKLQKGTVSKILSKSNVKPHKLSYYLEKKDPDFDQKMSQVLHVYKEVELYKANKKGEEAMIAILSYDEKPGIQAIEKTAADLSPVPGKYSNWSRDYEYTRHGTLSLLASIDLITGKIYAQVENRHRSKEFVEYLKGLNKLYPEKFKSK